MSERYRKFSELEGLTLSSVVVSDDNERVTFTTHDGDEYALFHDQDCCESVEVEDVVGELEDLLDTPIQVAEERESTNENPKDEWDGSCTWTFYTLRTIKGTVTIRWYGSSNGYYSESVDFSKIN